ncbi:uncharacterized protein LOC106400066 [Brassica napus]|uniref:uncharacterized protein LOC106400066 n=1 Tax=Brassica napus TaxID=3708 RepID=UPI00207AB5FD|nr:uncharacterized protein LOC106400066 [Brassica napus]
MAIVEEPILSRLDRIDFMVKKLEERSIGKKHQSRSMEQVMEETKRKGTFLERLNNVEEQVLKLCSHYEEEFKEAKEKKTKKKKRWLRKLVDKVVGPSSPTNNHSSSWRR